MDLQKIINDLLAQFGADAKLVEKFKADPATTVQGLLKDIKLDPAQLTSVIEAITAKLGLDKAKAGGIVGMVKGLFGKK